MKDIAKQADVVIPAAAPAGLYVLEALANGRALRFQDLIAALRSRAEAVAAFLAATALTHLSGRTNVFAMMEPFLPRLLAKSGICFERAGEDTDYHGIRAPYFIRTQSALQSMRPELEMLYNAIHGRIASVYASVGGDGR